jgi:hypothetical protein
LRIRGSVLLWPGVGRGNSKEEGKGKLLAELGG